MASVIASIGSGGEPLLFRTAIWRSIVLWSLAGVLGIVSPRSTIPGRDLMDDAAKNAILEMKDLGNTVYYGG